MKISIITLFPEMFKGPFSSSIVKHAQEKGAVSLEYIDIRDFGIGAHKVVDDTPYGGGIGMLMRVDVVKKAIDHVKSSAGEVSTQKVILMTADGKKYDQRMAEVFAKVEHLIILCGHYEGIDDRIREYVDEQICIGDFVVTGGEIPAMLITDSVVRLIDGVLKTGVTDAESFSHRDGGSYLLEHPAYTRPKTHDGHSVPDILLSGDHKKIDVWRHEQAKTKTKKNRPDLLKSTT